MGRQGSRGSAKTPRKIVIINVGAWYTDGTWDLDKELVWVAESAAALAAGTPSTGIIEEILKRVEHTRRQTILVRWLSTVALALLVLVAAVLWNWRQAVTERRTAQAQRLVALAEAEHQAHPENLEMVTLLLLESLRQQETPGAIRGLANATRLIRRTIAEVKSGSNVTAAAFDPSGSLVAASGGDQAAGYCGVWECSASLTPRWRRDGGSRSISWSPDGRMVAWNGTDAVTITDARSGHVVKTLPFGGANQISFSPDGRWLAGAWSGGVWVWSTEGSIEFVTTIRVDYDVNALAFSPDGQSVAYGGANSLTVANVGRWVPVHTARIAGIVRAIAYSPNNAELAVPNLGGTVTIYDAGTLVTRTSFSQGTYVESALYSPTGRFILTRASGDGTAHMWDVDEGHESGRFEHDDEVTAAAFTPDGETVATASADRTVHMWQVLGKHTIYPYVTDPQWERARVRSDSTVNILQFDSRGRRLLTGSSDGYLGA